MVKVTNRITVKVANLYVSDLYRNSVSDVSNFQHLTGKYLLLHPGFRSPESPVESNLTFARNVENYYEKITALYFRRNVNRNLGVVQTDGVVMKCRQEGGESHQLKENLLGVGLRYSNMRTSLSEARYLKFAYQI